MRGDAVTRQDAFDHALRRVLNGMAVLFYSVITRVRPIRPPLRLLSRLPLTSYFVPSMPLKRAVSSGKRKADSATDGEKSEQTKKAKVAVPDSAEPTGLAPNGQPTNKVLPVNISFPPRADGATRIASWNICGLAASQKKVRRYNRRRARTIEIKIRLGF